MNNDTHFHPHLDDMTPYDILLCDECARIAADACLDYPDDMTLAEIRNALIPEPITDI